MSQPSAQETTPSVAPAAHAGSRRYLLVWGALLLLTLLTIVTGRLQLGGANLPLALTIAGFKAGLVVLFFMHLWEDPGVNRLVLGVAVFFVVLLTLGVTVDFATRLPSALPPGTTSPTSGAGPATR